MDRYQASEGPLGHFDRPKTHELPDFEWVEEIISFDSAANANQKVDLANSATDRFILVPKDTRRGICWVLAWAGAIAVFAVAASVLAEFAFVFSAEQALSIAARAGAMEATLPRATRQSVAAAVDRRLQRYPLLAKQRRFSLLQNGSLVQTQLQRYEGDYFTVSLSCPSNAAIPEWLLNLLVWREETAIHASAEQQLLGRKVACVANPRARN